MKNHTQLVFGALAALLALSLLSGCDTVSPSSAQAAEISVDELASKLDSVTVCDANGADTRSEYGVIPGAVLLSDYSSYDIGVLPKDKTGEVVFYCASEKCSAAPKAAGRAVSEGYTNVRVLRAGIKGWAEAGKPVDKKKG